MPMGNRDMEESPLGWAGSRTDDKQASTENDKQKTTPTTSPKRTKKPKNRRTRSIAPEQRQSHGNNPTLKRDIPLKSLTMPHIYKIATVNVNGLATQPRITMLEDSLKKQEIDSILLQEITKPVFDDIRGFVAHTNIGTTEILSRDQIQLTNIVCLPTVRGMAARFQNVTLVNTCINAPSGGERRRETEEFFASEVPYCKAYQRPL